MYKTLINESKMALAKVGHKVRPQCIIFDGLVTFLSTIWVGGSWGHGGRLSWSASIVQEGLCRWTGFALHLVFFHFQWKLFTVKSHTLEPFLHVRHWTLENINRPMWLWTSRAPIKWLALESLPWNIFRSHSRMVHSKHPVMEGKRSSETAIACDWQP